MAEKSLVPASEKLPVKSFTQRFGFDNEPSQNAKYLRATLTFLREAGSEQIKQIPGFGPLLAGACAAIEELSKEEDDQKLEQRIEKLQTVGEQTQEDVTLLMVMSFAMFARLEPLIQALNAAGLPTGSKQLSEFTASTALTAYRGRVIEEFRSVDYRGISGSVSAEHATALALDDVYISPHLLPEHARIDINEREINLLKKLDDPDLPPDQKARCHEEYILLTGQRWRTGSEGTLIGEILEQTRHIVVKGNPGVGKSMLVRSLARACAFGGAEMQQRLNWQEDLIPVVLPLAAFADARRAEARRALPPLTLREFLDQEMISRGGAALSDAIAVELDAGKVFVLLDGVDEVPEDTARTALVQAVDAFIFDHSTNYCLVTSRPYGYVRLAGNLPHYQLLHFTQEQVTTFVYQWQRTFEGWLHPQAPNLEAADREAEAMLGEIRSNTKVAELATNPLILVIISLIRYAKIRLPDKRVELYAHAVDTLMETWNQWRSLIGKDMGGIQLPRERLITVWSSAAEWMRRTRPTGVVHQEDLKRELVRILQEEEYDEQNPAATAVSYLKAAADRAGLLEERGPGIFAFWHPTFEEYLAAVKLSTPTGAAQERLLLLRDDPRWREVILLAVGHIGVIGHDERTATDIVAAIADAAPVSPLEPLLHSRLLLAAACVADDVGIKRSLGRRIVVRLGEVIQSLPYKPLKEAFKNTVHALPSLHLEPQEIAALSPLASHKQWSVRMAIASLCSNVTQSSSVALQVCKDLLGDEDPDVACHAALGLVRAGDYRAEVFCNLANFNSSEAKIEKSVCDFFSDNFSDVGEILNCLVVDKDPQTSVKTASLLVGLGRSDEAVVSALVSLLGDQNGGVRYQAAFSLIELDRSDEAVVLALVALLKEEENIHYPAASLLVRLGRSDEAVVSALVSLLGDQNGGVRYRAASSLVELDRSDEAVVSALVSLLGDQNGYVRYQAASSLIRLGHLDQPVVPALVTLLGEENKFIQYQAASLLIRLDYLDEAVVSTLTTLLKNQNESVRYQAASSLIRLGHSDDATVSALVSCLEEGEDDEISAADMSDVLMVDLRSTGFMSALIKLANPGQDSRLNIFQKVTTHQAVTEQEGHLLTEAIQIQQTDTTEQRAAKELLFDWIWDSSLPEQQKLE